MNNKDIECPICRSGGAVLEHIGTRDNKDIDVYMCTQCGTKFLNVRDCENDYENGFMYDTNNMSELNIEQRLQSFKNDDMRRYNMVRDICKGKQILDFGCGFGGFLRYIVKEVKSCVGVELGKAERGYLNENGIKCLKTIDDCEDKFDVITLFHVFEHLNNPTMWLNKFANYLNRDGYLIIEVPNANDALLSLYECEKFADFTYWSAHLFLYTKKSLSMVIESVGQYEIISAGQVQRYPLPNHLMWLAKGMPGGQVKWNCLNSMELDNAYFNKLEELDMCDTLFFVLRKK